MNREFYTTLHIVIIISNIYLIEILLKDILFENILGSKYSQVRYPY